MHIINVKILSEIISLYCIMREINNMMLTYSDICPIFDYRSFSSEFKIVEVGELGEVGSVFLKRSNSK